MFSFINLYSQNGEVKTVKLFSSDAKLDERQREKLREHIGKLTLDLKNSNDKATIYASRAMAYLSLKEYTAAISDFSKLIEMDSEDSESYFLRGLCKQFSQKSFMLTSCDDFRKAKQLGYQKADWNTIGADCPDK